MCLAARRSFPATGGCPARRLPSTTFGGCRCSHLIGGPAYLRRSRPPLRAWQLPVRGLLRASPRRCQRLPSRPRPRPVLRWGLHLPSPGADAIHLLRSLAAILRHCRRGGRRRARSGCARPPRVDPAANQPDPAAGRAQPALDRANAAGSLFCRRPPLPHCRRPSFVRQGLWHPPTDDHLVSPRCSSVIVASALTVSPPASYRIRRRLVVPFAAVATVFVLSLPWVSSGRRGSGRRSPLSPSPSPLPLLLLIFTLPPAP